MEELLKQLAEREPTHPLLAVLAPIVEEDDAQLLKKAVTYHKQLRDIKAQDPARDGMLDIFERLIFTRFKNISKEELKKMLVPLTPITETRAYKEIFAEGKSKARSNRLIVCLPKG